MTHHGFGVAYLFYLLALALLSNLDMCQAVADLLK